MKIEVIFHEVSGIQNECAFEIWAQGAIIRAFSPQTEQLLCVTTGFAAGNEANTVGLASRKDLLLHGNNNNHGTSHVRPTDCGNSTSGRASACC